MLKSNPKHQPKKPYQNQNTFPPVTIYYVETRSFARALTRCTSKKKTPIYQ